MSGIKLFVCAYFSPEAQMAVQDMEGLEADDIIPFPSHCGQHPVAWKELIDRAGADAETDHLLILGGCCLHTFDATLWPAERLTTWPVEQCFYLFCPPEIVDHYYAQGCHLLSPGWLKGWRNQIEHVMGFDRATAKEFYRETATRLVLIDTGSQADSEAALRDLGEYLELPTEKIHVGVGYFRLLLTSLVQDIRLQADQARLSRVEKRQSEYAMLTDILGKLTSRENEFAVIDALVEMVTMLFAPGHVQYIPVHDGKAGKAYLPGSDADTSVLRSFLAGNESYVWSDSNAGFLVRLSHAEETQGIILIDDIAFPEYRQHYLNLALSMAGVASLAIDHARAFQRLTDLSHLAGKGEVARELVHNAGNILNSINITSQKIHERIDKSAACSLAEVVHLMQGHRDELGSFMADDAQGKKLLPYFEALTETMSAERETLLGELRLLGEHIEHLRQMISSQNDSTDAHDLLELADLEWLVETVLALFSERMEKLGIELERDYGELRPVPVQKHKLLQIIQNLVSNAIDALAESQEQQKRLILRLSLQQGMLCCEVEDNGIGIAAEVQDRVFSHGFSSKANHSGFGLHSAANMAKEMGGKLSLTSRGKGKGAVFHLQLKLDEKFVKEMHQ